MTQQDTIKRARFSGALTSLSLAAMVVHIFGASVILGGFILGLSPADLLLYFILTAISGAFRFIFEWQKEPGMHGWSKWFTPFKLLLIAACKLWPQLAVELIVCIYSGAAITSHMKNITWRKETRK